MKVKLATPAVFISGLFFAQGSYTWTGKPLFDIEARRNNQTLGIIKVELFPRIAPKHTRSFDSLVSVKFYDTTAFHRVIPGFVIQGGDPNSRHGPQSTWGQGHPSQPTVDAEFSVARHLRGTFAGARKANDTNSYTSQFYICVTALPQLNKNYTIFGRVLSGMDVVDTIVNAPANSNDQPLQKIEMFVTRNGSNDTVPQIPLLISPPPDTNFTPSVAQMKWNSVHDAVLYEFQLAHDSTFNAPILNMPMTALFVNYAWPQQDTTFWWRVRANNGGHFSPWATRRFTTFTLITGLTPQPPDLVRVFPNPSAALFTFSGLTEGSILEIYDSTGRRIVSREVKNKPEIIDLQGQDAGVYHYRCAGQGVKERHGSLLVH